MDKLLIVTLIGLLFCTLWGCASPPRAVSNTLEDTVTLRLEPGGNLDETAVQPPKAGRAVPKLLALSKMDGVWCALFEGIPGAFREGDVVAGAGYRILRIHSPDDIDGVYVVVKRID